MARNLRYGTCGSVTVGRGGSALVTGAVSTGSGGGGGAATVDVGSGAVDTGRAPAAVVTVSTACVTCVVAVFTGAAAVFAVVVTACVTEPLDGRELGTDAPTGAADAPAGTAASAKTGAAVSGWA